MRASLFGLSLVAALVLSACSFRGRVVTDEEIAERGEWTPADATARRLLDSLGGGTFRPVRLVPTERRFVDVLVIAGVEIPVPRLSAFGTSSGNFAFGIDLSALLGLDYEKRYYYLRDERAYVLLSRGRPPVIVPEDPDGPTPGPDADAPPEAFERLAAELRADMERLFGEGPPRP